MRYTRESCDDARRWILANTYGDESETDQSVFAWDYYDYLVNNENKPDPQDYNLTNDEARTVADGVYYALTMRNRWVGDY